MSTNRLLQFIATIAMLFARFGAGAASLTNSYQPELPRQLISTHSWQEKQ